MSKIEIVISVWDERVQVVTLSANAPEVEVVVRDYDHGELEDDAGARYSLQNPVIRRFP